MEGLWSFAGSESNAHLALAAGLLPPKAVERLGCYEHVQCSTQFGNRHIHIGSCVCVCVCVRVRVRMCLCRVMTCLFAPAATVGGAHMLDQTVEDVEMVIGLLKSQDRLAGIFLELCNEREGMLHDLQNPVPEVTLQPLSQTLREEPLRLIDVCMYVCMCRYISCVHVYECAFGHRRACCRTSITPHLTSPMLFRSRFSGLMCRTLRLRSVDVRGPWCMVYACVCMVYACAWCMVYAYM